MWPSFLKKLQESASFPRGASPPERGFRFLSFLCNFLSPVLLFFKLALLLFMGSPPLRHYKSWTPLGSLPFIKIFRVSPTFPEDPSFPPRSGAGEGSCFLHQREATSFPLGKTPSLSFPRRLSPFSPLWLRHQSEGSRFLQRIFSPQEGFVLVLAESSLGAIPPFEEERGSFLLNTFFFWPARPLFPRRGILCGNYFFFRTSRGGLLCAGLLNDWSRFFFFW